MLKSSMNFEFTNPDGNPVADESFGLNVAGFDCGEVDLVDGVGEHTITGVYMDGRAIKVELGDETFACGNWQDGRIVKITQKIVSSGVVVDAPAEKEPAAEEVKETPEAENASEGQVEEEPPAEPEANDEGTKGDEKEAADTPEAKEGNDGNGGDGDDAESAKTPTDENAGDSSEGDDKK